MNSYVGIGRIAVLVLLLSAACTGTLGRPAPSGRLTSPLVAPTVTPARARLGIVQLSQVPRITSELCTTTPVGDAFLVVTATLFNTGNTALHPALLDLTLEDASGRTFPRAQEAEFMLRTAGEPMLLDQEIPPGTEVQALLIFDVTGVTSPVRLAMHLPEHTVYSAGWGE